MKKHPVSLLVAGHLLLAYTSLCPAQIPRKPVLTPAQPADVGMSKAVLDAASSLFSEAVARGDISGAVLLVARRGRIVMRTAVGWRDIENEVPMTTDSLFNMQSMVKAVVSAGALILAEQRKLDLDAPVSRYIPEFARGRSSQILVRHLMNHTSGFQIPSAFVGPLVRRSEKYPDAPSLQIEAGRYPEVGPQATPGTTFSYSNVGYNTLGAVIEIASGKRLDVFLQESVFRPLNMHDTSLPVEGFASDLLAKQYRPEDGKLQEVRHTWLPFPAAGGGLVSTALDYARFCQMYLNGGGYGEASLLSSESVALATSATVESRYIYPSPEQLKARNITERWYYRRDPRGLGLVTAYGYGWAVGDGVFSHPGLSGTFAWIDQKRELVGIILTQCNEARIPGIEFINVVTAAVQDKTSESSK